MPINQQVQQPAPQQKKQYSHEQVEAAGNALVNLATRQALEEELESLVNQLTTMQQDRAAIVIHSTWEKMVEMHQRINAIEEELDQL